MTSMTSKWEVFFNEAGIPSKLAKDYSATFSDNRMRLDMLSELSKELLQDLGITAVGDVIAILRHAKIKHKEIVRINSLSPGELDEHQPLSKKPKTAKIPSIANESLKQSTNQLLKDKTKTNSAVSADTSTTKPFNGPSLRIEAPKTSPVTKPKEGRKKLSDRFDTMKKDSNTKQLQEEAVEKKQKEQVTTKEKIKPTVFTVQMSSTSIPTKKPIPNQKITVVPAQGKPLNRNKQPSSIFDRLEVSEAKSSRPHMDVDILKKKQTVFNRLGNKVDDEPQKIQKVSAMLRLDTTSASSEQKDLSQKQQQNYSQPTQRKNSSNVFNRLGDR